MSIVALFQRKALTKNCSPNENQTFHFFIRFHFQMTAVFVLPLEGYKQYLAELKKKEFVGELTERVRSRSPAHFKNNQKKVSIQVHFFVLIPNASGLL